MCRQLNRTCHQAMHCGVIDPACPVLHKHYESRNIVSVYILADYQDVTDQGKEPEQPQEQQEQHRHGRLSFTMYVCMEHHQHSQLKYRVSSF